MQLLNMGGIPPIFFALIFLFTSEAFAEPPQAPTTWRQAKFKKTVKQSEDFSCGAASISTLLTYDLESPTSEALILKTIKESISEREWEKSKDFGFSLYDLKITAEKLGFLSEGFKIDFNTLTRSQYSLIVHLKKGEYQHFVVFRGYINGQIYLSDPNNGDVRLAPDLFLDEWTGYALAVLDKKNKKNLPAEQQNDFNNSKIQAIRNAITFEHPYWQGLR